MNNKLSVQDVDRCVECGHTYSEWNAVTGQCEAEPINSDDVCGCKCAFPSTSVSEAFEFHEFVGIGAGELGMTPCELCGTLERDPVHADKFRVSEAEDKNSVSGASDCSTSRIPKDIQAVVAEIRERRASATESPWTVTADQVWSRGATKRFQIPHNHADRAFIANAPTDVDSLLSIIDTLQPSWQPIETAPKDGTEILLAHANSMWLDQWTMVNELGGFWMMCDQWDDPEVPTHWMPAPALPDPITQDTASAKASNSTTVPDPSQATLPESSSESESTLVTVDEAARRAAEKIWASLEGITYPDILEIITTELSVHQPDVQVVDEVSKALEELREMTPPFHVEVLQLIQLTDETDFTRGFNGRTLAEAIAKAREWKGEVSKEQDNAKS